MTDKITLTLRAEQKCTPDICFYFCLLKENLLLYSSRFYLDFKKFTFKSLKIEKQAVKDYQSTLLLLNKKIPF